MSLISPHIRALRAEAKFLKEQAEDLGSSGTPQQMTAAFVLVGIAQAKADAANDLEAEERALEERLAGPQPKGD